MSAERPGAEAGPETAPDTAPETGADAGPDLARAMLDQAKARARRGVTAEQRSAARAERAAARKGRKGGEPVAFGAAIASFLKAREWEREARTRSVLARWPEIAGPEIADHCTPTSLRDGELVLTAESTAWATQLTLLAGRIKDRVNSDLAATVVKSVRVHGPASARPRTPGAWRVSGGRGERDTYG